MAGLPVTIRLLDPPLHEFLPHEDGRVWRTVAAAAGVDVEGGAAPARPSSGRANPMLGLRGCRLGVLFPEIYEMQARAIFEAAVAVQDETGATVVPEVMVPLVAGRARAAADQAADRRGRGRGGRRSAAALWTTRSAP